MTATTSTVAIEAQGMKRIVGVVLVGLACFGILMAGNPRTDPSSVSAIQGNARFWGEFALDALEAEYFDSLEAMALSADVVLVGRIKDVTWGRHVLPDQEDGFTYMNLHVTVSRELGGRYADSEIVIELFPPEGASVELLRADLPEADQLLFLRNKGVEARSQSYPEDLAVAEDPFFRLVNIEQGRYSGVGGVVYPPSHAVAEWVRDLAETSFDVIVDSIDKLRSST